MSDFESQLISKVCSHGGVEKLISTGIDERHFYDNNNKEVWNFLVTHVHKYKTQPSFEVVKDNFEDYKWEIITDPIEYILDGFITEVKRREATEALYDLGSIIEENDKDQLKRLDEIFLDKAKELAQIVPTTRITKFRDMKQRIEDYRIAKESGVKKGMRFGLSELDELTLGLQPHEYISIVGYTGIGKSTIALWFLLNHYLDGHTPMFVSLEMDSDQVYRKLDSMAVGLRQHAIKSMELHPNDMKRWEEYADKCERVTNDLILVDVDVATVDSIYAEIARWNPDVTAVDYVQLMRPPKYLKNNWEQISHISREFKLMTRQLGSPIYGISQTNADAEDEGAKLSNIANSKDIGKHSDIVLGLHQDDSMYAEHKMEVRVLKSRDSGGKNKVIPMYWNPAIGEFRDWRAKDTYNREPV